MPPKQVVKTGGKKVSSSNAAKPPAATKQVFDCLTHGKLGTPSLRRAGSAHFL